MHIQHIESTFGHTGNISGPPLHNTKLTFDTPLWTYGAETHTDTHGIKRQYILCSISHVHPNIKHFFSLTGLVIP